MESLRSGELEAAWDQSRGHCAECATRAEWQATHLDRTRDQQQTPPYTPVQGPDQSSNLLHRPPPIPRQ